MGVSELRNKNRSASCPPLSLPLSAMIALEAGTAASSAARKVNSSLSSVQASADVLSLSATESSPSRAGGRTRMGSIEGGSSNFFVPMELDKARSILVLYGMFAFCLLFRDRANADAGRIELQEKEFVPMPATAFDAPPMTPLVNTEIVLERLCKGQSAWDTVLLGGRERHVPKVHHRNSKEGSMHLDTSDMSTAAMIQTHLNMLDKKATEITDESVGKFGSDQDAATQTLLADSRPLVEMWENRLMELHRIRAEVKRLSEMSAPVNMVTEKMQLQQVRINAVLRTGTKTRIDHILACPPISEVVPKHPESFKSVKRRERIQSISAAIDALRGPLADASRKATDLYVTVMDQLGPLEILLKETLDNATAAPQWDENGSIIAQRSAGTEDVNALHNQIAKIHHSYTDSKELKDLDQSAQEVLDLMMELDDVANMEEKVINESNEQAKMKLTLDAERKRVEEWNDLTKKIDWCWNDNPPELAKQALHSILAITRRIISEPDVIANRSISSNSRVSVIQHIIEVRWGADVLTAFGFYNAKFLWTVPSNMPLEKMKYGCKYLCKRLEIPEHLLTLYLQRRTSTVFLLMHLQRSIAKSL